MNLLHKFHALFRRGKLDADMTEEMRHHVELQTELNLKSGMNHDEARYAALRQFGNIANIQEQAREGRGLIWLEQLRRDFRVAIRRLVQRPGFTATALATLAICIGTNLAIFALVDSILLRPLPFPDPDRLALIFNTYPQAGVMRDGSSITNYYERRGNVPAFSELALYRPSPAMVGEGNLARREQIIQVSPEFFSVLGRGPVKGRTFIEEETNSSRSHVLIISDLYWHQHFNSDPQIIGRQMLVNGALRTVVGVLPPDFRFLSFGAQLYFPLTPDPASRTPQQRHSGGNVTQMIGRLQVGFNFQSAQAQIDAHNASVGIDDPNAKRMADAGFRSMVVPLHSDHVAAIRPTLWLMQAGGFLLLLIGVVNLANLLLVRAIARERELAIRQAIGASRIDLITEIMAETFLLTVIGSLIGMAVGAAGIRLLTALGADKLPLGAQLAFDGRIALLAMTGAVILGFAIGLPSLWVNLRKRSGNCIQPGTHGNTASYSTQRLRHVFIVVQLALAFVLLVGAGQLALSLKNTLAVLPGFRAENILTGKVWVSPGAAASLPALVEITEKIVTEISRLPGVSSAGMVTNVPFSGASGKSAATVKGYVIPAGESPQGRYSYSVTGDYFQAMAFNLRSGRFLTADDSRRAERVCVVDDDFARYYWPGGDAIGHILFQGPQQGPDADGYKIVGVVGAVKQAGLTDQARPGAVYYPWGHRPDRDVYVVIRSNLAAEALGSSLQNAIARVNPTLPLSELRTMESRIADSLAAQRTPALLSGIFAAVSLLLAGIGTYGLLSYAVAQRYREIGIRIALGAQSSQISGDFLLLAFRLVAMAGMVGTGLAWFSGQAMQAVLFEVPAFAFSIWIGTAVVLVVITLGASLFPARRASRVDPVQVLRSE